MGVDRRLWPGLQRWMEDAQYRHPKPYMKPPRTIEGVEVPCRRVLGHGEYCQWDMLCDSCALLIKLFPEGPRVGDSLSNHDKG